VPQLEKTPLLYIDQLLASTATETGYFFKAEAKADVPETSVNPDMVNESLVQEEALHVPS